MTKQSQDFYSPPLLMQWLVSLKQMMNTVTRMQKNVWSIFNRPVIFLEDSRKTIALFLEKLHLF